MRSGSSTNVNHGRKKPKINHFKNYHAPVHQAVEHRTKQLGAPFIGAIPPNG